ncbi:MAG: cysteine--tRNA ligase [Bacteriovoracaceae bacterium]|nr:cysteine--tRNA ligase [Bacteriovoracaceae bacterium]
MPQEMIKVYDTLSAKKEVLMPRVPGQIKIYGCGPTVYGYTHVGNGRTFLTQDLVVRILRLAGYQVLYARNYTDIDDKIILKAEAEKKTSEAVASFYTKAFDQNMADLEIVKPDYSPRATETIPSIIQMIEGLIKKNLAYVSNGDVYYRVDKFARYGCLSHRKLKDMMTGTRIEADEQKENVVDFALWKNAKPGEPSWKSPWGSGRPGWHIECSAMIHDIFDDALDIHMGGLDLIFPHHENEIAQSEGLTEKKLATYWVHGGMLEVGKEKMSKSLGNLMTISDFIKDYGAETMRLLFAQNHYRSPLEFSSEAILRSEALVDRLYLCKKKALESSASAPTKLPAELEALNSRIKESLFDDFNGAKAMGLILAAARVCFRENKPEFWKAWGDCLSLLDEVFGLTKRDPDQALSENRNRRLARMKISAEESQRIDSKLLERLSLREQKKFAEADQVRKDLETQGIVVMDGPDGTTWTVAV